MRSTFAVVIALALTAAAAPIPPAPKVPITEEKPTYVLWLMWRDKNDEADHAEYETDNVVELIKLARGCGEKHGSCEVVVLRKDKDGMAWPIGFYTVPGKLEEGHD